MAITANATTTGLFAAERIEGTDKRNENMLCAFLGGLPKQRHKRRSQHDPGERCTRPVECGR
jgi:hypothetical protein